MPLKTVSKTTIFGCKFTGGQVQLVIISFQNGVAGDEVVCYSSRFVPSQCRFKDDVMEDRGKKI
jgi:hypothetical protein